MNIVYNDIKIVALAKHFYLNKVLFAVIMCTLMIAGCAGRSPAPTYYVLHGDTATLSSEDLPSGKGIALYKVDIPAYLERNNIVSRESDGIKLVLAEYHQWAEPLDKGVKRILNEVMTPIMLKKGVLLLAPNDDIQLANVRVDVEIQRFDGILNGEAVLEARFTAKDKDEVVLTRGIFIEKIQAGQSYDSLVAAQSQLLVNFGNAIAPKLLSVFVSKSKL